MKIINALKRYSMPIAAMFITAVILIIIMIIKQVEPFGGYSFANIDCIHQYIPFLNEYRRKLLSGEGLQFSWNIQMGTDFMMPFIYYLSSPINFIIVLFDSAKMDLFVSVSFFVKVTLAALTMGLFLESKNLEKKHDPLVIALSVSYALSAYVLGYGWNIMWLDCIMIFPVIMIGTDRLINEDKPVIYVLSLAFCIFANFYLSIIVCLFLVIRFFTNQFDDIKDFIRKGIRFAAFSLLAAGLTFITLYITVNWLLTSSTIIEEEAPSFSWYSGFFSIFRNMYMFSKAVIKSNVRSDANIYSGILPVILLFFIPSCKGIKLREKLSFFIVGAFLIISMNNDMLNFVWHGFHSQAGIPNRFSFVFIFLMLEMTYMVMKKDVNISVYGIMVGCALAMMMPIVVYFFTDYDGVYSSKKMLIIAIVMSAIYSLLFIIYQMGEKTYLLTRILISVLIISEIGFNAFKTLEVVFTEPIMRGMEGRFQSVDEVEGVNKDNKDFYREEIYDYMINNENTFQGIHGVGTFSSVQDSNLMTALDKLGYEYHYPVLDYNGTTEFMDDLLGVRYVHAYFTDRMRFDYPWIYQSEAGDIVFENSDALPIGYGIKKSAVNNDLSDSNNYAENQNKLSDLIAGENAIYEPMDAEMQIASDNGEVVFENGIIKVKSVDEKSMEEHFYIDGYFEIPENGEYYIQFYNYDIDQVYLQLNETVLPSEEGNSKMIYLGAVHKGDVIIYTIDILKEHAADIKEIPVFVSKYNEDAEKKAIEFLAQNTFTVTEYDGNSLKGTFDIDDEKLMMLTVPYSKGWSIKLDGKKIEPVKVMDCFIGIEAESGTHTIEMQYRTPGLVMGWIGTAFFWGVFIVYIVIKRKGLIANQRGKDEQE